MGKLTKKLGFITCGLLLTSSISLSANEIDKSFKDGKISGSATLYAISKDKKNSSSNVDNSYSIFNLSYETASYKGINLKTSFIGGHSFGDENLEKKSLMSESYIQYSNDLLSLALGRQAIDLEWLGDYNEAVVLSTSLLKDTSIVLGYVNQQATADEDEIGDFKEITKDGAYVFDAKYSGILDVQLNPYYYVAVDVAKFYGLKASYNSDTLGATAHYAKSHEDKQKDGSIAHIELNTKISAFSLATGYIKAGKDVGVGSISAYGDNISPFDEGVNTYSKDAKTYYGSLAYSLFDIDLAVLYGETKFSTNSKESELNITAGYSFSDSLALSLLYVDYDLDKSTSSDFSSISGTLSYSF